MTTYDATITVTGLAQVTIVNNTHAEVVNKVEFPATYTFTSSDSLTFIAVPAAGFSFTNWTVSSVPYSANPYTTIALVAAYAITGTAVAVQPYSTVAQAETWAPDYLELGADYATQIAYLISIADRAIDHELEASEGYFVAGGIEFVERYDGAELGCVPFGMLLRFKHNPVLDVASVVADGNTLTEDTDYIVEASGIRFLRNAVDYDYGNITITYTAGYTATPMQISNVSAQLAAAIIHRIIDSKTRKIGSASTLNLNTPPSTFSDLAVACFTDSLRAELKNYRLLVPAKVV